MSLFQATAPGKPKADQGAERMVVFQNNRVDSIDLSEPEGRGRPRDLERVELATMRGCLVP